MERIVIPGRATYAPVSLTDLMAGAPLASRLLLGTFLPGHLLSAGVFGYYAGSAARDALVRRKVRYVDFQETFGGDVDTLEPMPVEARLDETRALAEALNDGFVAERPPREELARTIGSRLTAYHASITGQEVVFSTEIRDFTLARLVFPFVLGACDPISGDVAIFQDTGIFEPHVIAHEFCHRLGYLKELHAQVLAWAALRTSGDPVLVQGARAERLQRQLDVISGGDAARFAAVVAGLGLRRELQGSFRCLRARDASSETPVVKVMRAAYDRRMRLTGQNGLSDYDEGFTNLLWMLGRSDTARQPRSHAAV